MAKYQLELPNEIIKNMEKIYGNTDKIFGEMTKAGAEVVASNVRTNAPETIKGYVKITRTYKTPSDDGINTKVIVNGYLPFSDKNRKSFSRRGKTGGQVYSTSKGVPASFLANLYEYGRSTAPFPKHPFLRKSFNKGQIEKVMLEAQKKYSGGLLDE